MSDSLECAASLIAQEKLITMIARTRFYRWTSSLVVVASVMVAIGCTAVPRRYIWMADTTVTLTNLSSDLPNHVGKVVLMGGTITEEEQNDQYVFLHLKNRPLDQDYKPHRPPSLDGPEAGEYWVAVPQKQLPSNYRNWGRVTVAGRVTGERFLAEPVLLLLYMRGWDTSGKHNVWENIDPQYVPSVPLSVH